MKRVISFVVCILMLFTSVVFADTVKEDNTIEKALLSVKSRIMPTDLFENFTSEKSTTELEDTYRFVWETSGDKYSRLRVVINGEDIITNYSFSDENSSYDQKPTVNKMTSDEAILYAQEHIYTLNPKLRDEIRIIAPRYDELYSKEYTFNVQRTHNGVDVYEDTGYITISSDGKTLRSFYINYTPNLEFNDEKFLTKDEAIEHYTQKMPLDLVYEISYNTEKSKSASLMYIPSAEYNTYIRATDGGVFTPDHYSVYGEVGLKNSAASGMARDESASDKIIFSDAERAEINEVNGLIGLKEAEKLVRENKALSIDQNLVLKNSTVNGDFYEDGKYLYNMTFYSDIEGESVNVSCNAKTGEIIYYYRHKNNSNPDTVTDEEAEKIAQSKVNELAKKYFENEKDMYVLEDSKNGTLTFKRQVNGILCPQNEIRITISKKDGLVNSFNINHDNINFPQNENVISPYMIHKCLFEQYEYTLKYVRSYDKEKKAYQAVGVYMFDNHYIKLDALTGEMAVSSTEEAIEDYTDIDGHYAKDAINTLKRFAIGFSGGKFEPDKTINIGEFLSLLNTVFDYGTTPIILKDSYNYKIAYDYGLRRELINKDEDTKNPLTREKACIMLIKALGYEDVAKLESIYIPKFADVKNNIGYISILCGMGIVNGDGSGNFSPDTNLTRASAAMMLYNYLLK